MNGELLLDTNAVIDLLAGERLAVERIAAADEIFMAAIVLGELYYGARRSNQFERQAEVIRTLTARHDVLFCDEVTAEHYGHLKNELRRAGTPIPENDIWIAALAVQHNLTLMSRDEHFRRLPTLQLVEW